MSSAAHDDTEYRCKICQGSVIGRHTISDITYYYCSQCDFLQNYYWESPEHRANEQTTANELRRLQCWPAGEGDHMYEKGWEILELMYWPLAWFSRQINEFMRIIPVYNSLAHSIVKYRAGRLLDFGCGHGVTVLELRRQDNMDVVGLDPYSPTANANIYRKNIFEAKFPNNAFDGIFSIETVEHLPNPIEVFIELARILKPGGKLLVQSSRLEDPEYQLSGDKWFYLEDPKTHVSIYSKKAMTTVSKKAGFRSVRFRGAKLACFVKRD